jgi:aspartyl-tRNA(Asn)/glutamyl-tRNA(Gln) amidotransferase subunit C
MDHDQTAVPRIAPDEVKKVARLARLSLTESEVDEFSHQLSDILDHADDLDLLDLDGVAPLAHPLPLVNVFRDDVPGPALYREAVLAAAPAAEEGQFRVPPVLGEEL